MSRHPALTELYRGENPIVDIVAVHGLNGDALMSWTTSKTGRCWLREPDMLPSNLPQARVLTYSYNASVTELFGRTSSDRILEHAHTLVAELIADRQLENASRRPLIFVCHSLGGIIVKRAIILSQSRTAKSIQNMHSIYVSTFGLLFLGTPHDGSTKAGIASSTRRIVDVMVPSKLCDTDGQLLEALKPGSEALKNITDLFVPLMKKFRIYFFWEQEKTDLHVTNDYIVTESSAAPILDGTERCGLPYDHRNLCRFESRTSPGYRVVVAALMRYSEEASYVVAQRWIHTDSLLRSMRTNEAAELFIGT
ncbi:hypothetical protein A1O1_01232 [Capronia coronata CBS 617.96]|uniref:DUF676 domain-containing protein n=1 Tax=Capronia coronata CBS 617.96 TaxID=1182541 RepID=W9Z3E5_9EURO|nr:uncharacterized protein A1O1_01232 [Capronia coronata CBS 617.96]EXJ96106.1 hypothetical protein A1O1_01232 [Capronia coronata CBS 617.96]